MGEELDMKRQILTLVTVLALLATGAVFAQSTLNTPAPGPSQETKPGQTNNNLQNPGNPQMQQPAQQQPVRENGTVEGTATESNTRDQADQTGTTGTTTTTTGTTTGTTGTMNNMDQTTTPPTTTTGTTTGTTTTGTYNSTTGTTTTTGGTMDNTDTSATSDRLPNTASDLPTLALMGLLALSLGFALRAYAKRNA
jgi:cytoskeletal protein RodZ